MNSVMLQDLLSVNGTPKGQCSSGNHQYFNLRRRKGSKFESKGTKQEGSSLIQPPLSVHICTLLYVATYCDRRERGGEEGGAREIGRRRADRHSLAV